MKYILILLLLFAAPLMAQDSGLYLNSERPGEGINLIRNGDKVVVYFYTYQPHPTCWNIEVPEGGLVNEEICNEQRWFMIAGDKIVEDTALGGILYMGVGLDYPKCIPTASAFQMQCGEAIAVGQYLMERYNNGWRMVVKRLGVVLEKDDPLFNRVWEFTTKLFSATD